ncbi:V-type ATPase 116kDa subunit family protein [Nocardia sp. alder85J]|uniref:V-type ATPase 116kDa subunit family protein n=1 Tax=Nocardia sp. alder85J TaxID=2862949 RepID=UPI001CD726B9|nr:V-type ATPase 116kDa subunit family protein [Nocardia sp. alder85J]MCX4092452.1 ATPase [Nocardia sp. alder85J]
MNWSENFAPVRMQRIAVVAPTDALRDVLVAVAAAGVWEPDHGTTGDRPDAETPPVLSRTGPDLAAWERAGRLDLLAGERLLDGELEAAVRRGRIAAWAGWCPESEVDGLRGLLRPLGAAAVPLPAPDGIDPPTLLDPAPRARRAFAPLVGVYGVVPYRDIDPTVAAGLAYVAMFGMMFGDLGHGLLLIAAAAVLRSGRIRRLASLRRLWVFVAGAGLAAAGFGVLYGEFFGPTGLVPVVWLNPLDEPVRLMLVALAAGAGLLGLSYGFGTVNRWREGGVRLALYSSSGIAGAATFLGLGVLAAGIQWRLPAVLAGGVALTAAGLVLSLIGMLGESGGGATGVVRSGIGLLDLVMHIGANVVSFARLAAFGMTHAALGWVVWRGTLAIAGHGPVGIAFAAVFVVVGNLLTFALEALVAGVQALRLEFYELFSRIFAGTGRSFAPWRIPIEETEQPC